MTLSHLARVVLVMALAGAGACKNTPTTRSGLPWWPQGPGNPPGGEPAATASEQSAPSTAAATTATPVTHAAAPSERSSAPPAPAAAAPSTETQATRYGDLLFLSGQIAADRGDIAQQTHAVMQKIGAILETHRLTMANIVHVTVHLANIRDVQAMDAAYASHFRGTLPARTVVEVAHLPGNALLQISVVAGR